MLIDLKLFLHRSVVPKLLCLVLALCIMTQWVFKIMLFRSVDTQAIPIPELPVMNRETIQNRFREVNVAFFGDYIPHNLNETDVKQSGLSLKVVGIIFSEQEGVSHVIIQVSGGKEKVFYEGDTLPGGAVIKRITQDGVLVVRDGELERLSLPKSELLFDAPAKPLKGVRTL